MGRSQKCESALAVFLIAVSAVFYQFIPEFVSGYRFHFPGTTDQAMTPDFFPRISVSLLMFSAFCVLITVPLRKSELPIFQLEFNQIKVVLTIIASVVGYVIMIWVIGFFAASIIFLFIFCFTANYKKPYIIFTAGFATNLVVMVLFEYGLSVQLPRGLILDSF
jgi:hypothetical protein